MISLHVDVYEKVNAWFKNSRKNMIYNSLKDIETRFADEINNDFCRVFTFGNFDQKLIIVNYVGAKESLICSVDMPFKSTNFFKKYENILEAHINSGNVYFATVNLKQDFIESLRSPKIALLSLAKNDVYTFPRFALGISDIAYAIRKNFKGSVSLYDLQLNSNIADFISRIKIENIDIIGISMTFGLFDVLENVLEAIKKEKLNCTITVGGSLTGLTYKEILKKYPDVIVSLSEGETFFIRLIDYFQGNCELKDISGIAFVDKKTNSIVQTSFCKFSRNVELSIPELDLLIPTIKAKGVFQLETSRGCYNACSFCPRKQKGIWRGSTDDVPKLESLINHFCTYLKNHNYDPSKFIVYVVDEEFVGGESTRYQNRAVEISKIFSKNNLKYETSFRMNTIYSHHLSEEKKIQKINNMMKLRDNGLNRTLVGVESGVQTVLERFNKNVTSYENTTGIRLLTGLGVPIRFTYITFDPLMNFEELKETYFYQGRKDLILKTDYKNDAENLLNAVKDYKEIQKLSKDTPFYSEIPYMLVSIECLVGSKYLDMAMSQDLATNKIITALGKQEVNYLDKRIGKMSHHAQLWIDRNFAIDYSLKSLSKIYLGKASLNIREQRILLKQHAYKLFGKMLYIIEPNNIFLQEASNKEVQFMEILQEKSKNIDDLDYIFKELLNHQFGLLTNQIYKLKENLKKYLCDKDFERIDTQISNWVNLESWQLLHSI